MLCLDLSIKNDILTSRIAAVEGFPKGSRIGVPQRGICTPRCLFVQVAVSHVKRQFSLHPLEALSSLAVLVLLVLLESSESEEEESRSLQSPMSLPIRSRNSPWYSHAFATGTVGSWRHIDIDGAVDSRGSGATVDSTLSVLCEEN